MTPAEGYLQDCDRPNYWIHIGFRAGMDQRGCNRDNRTMERPRASILNKVDPRYVRLSPRWGTSPDGCLFSRSRTRRGRWPILFSSNREPTLVHHVESPMRRLLERCSNSLNLTRGCSVIKVERRGFPVTRKSVGLEVCESGSNRVNVANSTNAPVCGSLGPTFGCYG